MAAPGDATLLLLAGTALVFGVSVWRSRRAQEGRLRTLESRGAPPEPPPRYRPVALSPLLPPAEPEQPTLQGHRLPGGLMAWTADAAAEDVVADLVLARDAPCAYVGPSPDAVARRVAERALQAGVDPRERLMIPATLDDPVLALERTLEARVQAPPWIVGAGGPPPRPPPPGGGGGGAAPRGHLERIHRRFGCAVLLLGAPEAPQGFLRLPS